MFSEVIKYVIRKRNYSLKHRYENARRNMRYRFESANSVEDLYNDITNDLTSFKKQFRSDLQVYAKANIIINVSVRV